MGRVLFCLNMRPGSIQYNRKPKKWEMAMHIPTLIIRCNVPAFVSLDGAALGCAASDEPLTLPVGPSGEHVLSALPLVRGYIAAARGIAMHQGRLICNSDSPIKAVQWPGGVVDIFLELEPLHTVGAFEPASTLARERIGSRRVTLFREGGIHLAIEDQSRQNEPLFSHTVACGGAASMESIDLPGATVLFILAKEKAGRRCCCVRLDREVVLTLEIEGAEIKREGDNVVCISALQSLRGLQKREVYDMAQGKLLTQKVGYFTCKEPPVENATDAALSLLDAICYGDKKMMRRRLGGALAELPTDDLQHFFGPFERCALPNAQVSENALVGLLDGGDVATARLFAFEGIEEDGDWRIVNAFEC